MTTGNCLCSCKNWACQIVFGWPYSMGLGNLLISDWPPSWYPAPPAPFIYLFLAAVCLCVITVIGSTLQMFTDELQTNCIHELFCSYNRYSSDPNSINFYIFINMEKYKYVQYGMSKKLMRTSLIMVWTGTNFLICSWRSCI